MSTMVDSTKLLKGFASRQKPFPAVSFSSSAGIYAVCFIGQRFPATVPELSATKGSLIYIGKTTPAGWLWKAGDPWARHPTTGVREDVPGIRTTDILAVAGGES